MHITTNLNLVKQKMEACWLKWQNLGASLSMFFVGFLTLKLAEYYGFEICNGGV
jgi:inner membrane protein involved in colicin E2 resistance